MKIKRYICSNGFDKMHLEFWDGCLRRVEIEKITNDNFLEVLRSDETAFLGEANARGYGVRRLPNSSTQEKVAIWCAAYKEMYGRSYKVTQVEAGMLKGVEVNRDLALFFFSLTKKDAWWADTKTISNYVKNYNEVRRLAEERRRGVAVGGQGKMDGELQDLAAEFQRRYGKKGRD